MKIILDEKYFITSDPLNYILNKTTIPKEAGKDPGARAIGFFGKNDQGMLQLCQKYILERQGDDMKDVEIMADEIVSRIIKSNILTADSVARMIKKLDENDS